MARRIHFLNKQRDLVANGVVYATDLNSLVKLWIFRMLVPLGGMKEFVHMNSFNNDTLAIALGLQKWMNPEEEAGLDIKLVFNDIRKLHKMAEQESESAALPVEFLTNVNRVAELVGLSEVDCRILELAVLLHIDTLLNEVADYLGNLTTIKMLQVISVVLDIPEAAVRESLDGQGILARSGLVALDRNGFDHLVRKTSILSQSFADTLYSSDADPISLLRDTVVPASPANIRIEDYAHIEKQLDILLPYIRHCVATRKKGVNILLHGAPGTGKTQLSRVIAGLNQYELFEISSEDSEGDPIDGKQRLSAYRAAQCFFANRESLLVFDEAEDVFSGGHGLFTQRSIAETRKAWMNRILEENTVPTFWLSNNIRCIDPAFVRRFDMIMEMPVPPKKHREMILQKQCGDLLDATTLKRLAEAENLAPAVMERTAAVVRSIQGEISADKLNASIELLVNSVLTSQGHKPVAKHNLNTLPEVYNPAFIHADTNLQAVATGLADLKSARLCLYGPPGTGKTAYGQWLSQQLNMPLLLKKGSDLLSMWVGGNEQNIANAFNEAGEQGAILMIDEVDSFLQDRRGAQRSWEITSVNEMLTQMESFNGIFIASTNLMQGLDQAALRRFDLKVKFDYLLPEQARQLFECYCRQMALNMPDEIIKRKLYSLDNLTPGDYAAVARQHRFRPIQTAEALWQAVAAECAVKENAPGKGIGFIRH